MNIKFSYLKRFPVWIPLLLMVISQSAKGEETDTLLYLPSAEKLTVIKESENTLELTVKSDGVDNRFFFDVHEAEMNSVSNYQQENSRQIWKKIHSLFVFPTRRANRYWTLGIDGFCFGLSSAQKAPSNSGLQWSKSIEISWLSIVNASFCSGPIALSLGAGIDWKNFKISTSTKYLSVDGNGDLKSSPYEEGIKGNFSRLQIFSLQFPLLFQYNFPGNIFSFSVGPVLDYNVHASVLTSFSNLKGETVEVENKFRNQKPLTFDIFGNLSLYRLVGIYVRYSPMQLMKSGGGLNFYPLTIGLSICV